jgi:glycosyltransferase involved in cell wall biosynthesis
VSPAWFAEDSYIGGGERYPTSLGEAMSRRTPTTLVTFGSGRRTLALGDLRLEVYPANCTSFGVVDPIAFRFVRQLWDADVVHCYQYTTFVSSLALIVASVLGKKVFMTDLGGGGIAAPFPPPYLGELATAGLAISHFAERQLNIGRPSRVIGGGVPPRFFDDDEPHGQDHVLFVGRLLPHKGIDHLIAAMDEDVPLLVVGRKYHDEYFALLQDLARHKDVTFLTDTGDDDLTGLYRSALVTVLPSVYRDATGRTHRAPELLGLTLLESCACGTPVISTDVGGMPEFVDDGVTGFVVPPNDTQTLRRRIRELVDDKPRARRMGDAARVRALDEFNWDAVVARCLDAYRSSWGAVE